MTPIKPKRLSEIQDLLSGPDFQQWWTEVEGRRADCEASQRRFDELLSEATLSELRAEMSQRHAIDTLYRADECAETAANLQLEADEMENRSFRAVSDFEEQRFKASELWYRAGAAEKHLEELKESTGAPVSKKAEGELRAAERDQRMLKEGYEREMSKKNRLWEEVERIWARSAEVNLLVAEHRSRAKKIRKEAEALLAVAEEAKKKGSQLRGEADTASVESDAARARLQGQLERARTLFGCAVGADFLYFRHKDNPKMAFCISLIEDRENYNVELRPLRVYSVERQKGVAFLEPAREHAGASEEEDQRFDRYFLSGRKGETRSTGP